MTFGSVEQFEMNGTVEDLYDKLMAWMSSRSSVELTYL